MLYLRPWVNNLQEVFLPYSVRYDGRLSLINKFISLIITNLMATNDTILSELLSKVSFLIDFVADVVSARLNIQYIATLLELIRDHKIACKLSIF